MTTEYISTLLFKNNTLCESNLIEGLLTVYNNWDEKVYFSSLGCI
jgi:hypothetical protein